MQKAYYTEKVEDGARIMPTPVGTDIEIRKFLVKTETEDGEIYEYEFNSFRLHDPSQDLLDDITENPYNYLDYSVKELTIPEKIDKNEAMIYYVAMMSDIDLPESED